LHWCGSFKTSKQTPQIKSSPIELINILVEYPPTLVGETFIELRQQKQQQQNCNQKQKKRANKETQLINGHPFYSSHKVRAVTADLTTNHQKRKPKPPTRHNSKRKQTIGKFQLCLFLWYKLCQRKLKLTFR
jgi:hypothetical protein